MSATDSLASKLKMPMSGAAQGGKKTVDEELDAQFGAKDDGDGSSKKFDPKMPLGEASVDQLQAALDAKQAEEDSETADEEKAEGDDGKGDGGDTESGATY